MINVKITACYTWINELGKTGIKQNQLQRNSEIVGAIKILERC